MSIKCNKKITSFVTCLYCIPFIKYSVQVKFDNKLIKAVPFIVNSSLKAQVLGIKLNTKQ